MKLFIWQGSGVSVAYHDDGTVVVLAESEQQAREIYEPERERLSVISEAIHEVRYAAYQEWQRAYRKEHGNGPWREPRMPSWVRDKKAWEKENDALPPYPNWQAWADTTAGTMATAEERSMVTPPDAPLPERPADRVIELDHPCVVAFNGGGYD